MIAAHHRPLVLLIAGFAVWSGAFVLLYGLQALGCAYDWPYHRPVLIAAYFLSLVPLGWLAMQRPAGKDEPATGLAVAALWANRAAFGAGILVFLPVAFVSVCV